ncbi:Protein of uncharacterised function (DUF3347) [Chryseobacterium nakagawai]|uniref:DUF3347 domain-containing protein n=1 Tax=Chryseobacterium nakagawai TaxID=1241982 RepID=A0AAD1DTD4_CHRNA|nr:DUF3347 domain-containing protein [Chryseobacterium nakagawai]AZA92839.1 DUF3347 domain-containing protein [Chryseobacterium nakagawai]VEH19451.1 Protein of uncharacterised function (DUF3347) [Chryseobacterium nakagawai]
MKNITLSIVAVIMAFVTVSCNQTSNKSEKSSNDSAVVSEEQSSAQPKENDTVTTTAVTDTSKGETVKTATTTFSIAPIITDYLSLKNALASNNDKAAASAGKKLFATLNKVDMNSIPADKHSKYMDIADDAKENAEHIGENAGNIDHQREHLASLSEDLKDLVSLFGTPQTLYQDHCPMFNDGKGAVWFSESKEIKNPYYGSKMISCGKVQQTINRK